MSEATNNSCNLETALVQYTRDKYFLTQSQLSKYEDEYDAYIANYQYFLMQTGEEEKKLRSLAFVTKEGAPKNMSRSIYREEWAEYKESQKKLLKQKHFPFLKFRHLNEELQTVMQEMMIKFYSVEWHDQKEKKIETVPPKKSSGKGKKDHALACQVLVSSLVGDPPPLNKGEFILAIHCAYVASELRRKCIPLSKSTFENDLIVDEKRMFDDAPGLRFILSSYTGQNYDMGREQCGLVPIFEHQVTKHLKKVRKEAFKKASIEATASRAQEKKIADRRKVEELKEIEESKTTYSVVLGSVKEDIGIKRFASTSDESKIVESSSLSISDRPRDSKYKRGYCLSSYYSDPYYVSPQQLESYEESYRIYLHNYPYFLLLFSKQDHRHRRTLCFPPNDLSSAVQKRDEWSKTSKRQKKLLRQYHFPFFKMRNFDEAHIPSLREKLMQKFFSVRSHKYKLLKSVASPPDFLRNIISKVTDSGDASQLVSLLIGECPPLNKAEYILLLHLVSVAKRYDGNLLPKMRHLVPRELEDNSDVNSLPHPGLRNLLLNLAQENYDVSSDACGIVPLFYKDITLEQKQKQKKSLTNHLKLSVDALEREGKQLANQSVYNDVDEGYESSYSIVYNNSNSGESDDGDSDNEKPHSNKLPQTFMKIASHGGSPSSAAPSPIYGFGPKDSSKDSGSENIGTNTKVAPRLPPKLQNLEKNPSRTSQSRDRPPAPLYGCGPNNAYNDSGSVSTYDESDQASTAASISEASQTHANTKISSVEAKPGKDQTGTEAKSNTQPNSVIIDITCEENKADIPNGKEKTRKTTMKALQTYLFATAAQVEVLKGEVTRLQSELSASNAKLDAATIELRRHIDTNM